MPPKRRNAISDPENVIRLLAQNAAADKEWVRQNKLMGISDIAGSRVDGMIHLPGNQLASDYMRHLGTLASIERDSKATAKSVSLDAISRGAGNGVSSSKAEGKGLVRSNRWLEHLRDFHSKNQHLSYGQAMSQAKNSYSK